jgi:mycothiol synthase
MAKILSSRLYAGPQDLLAMLALIKKRPPSQIDDFPGSIDLQELLAIPKAQAHTCLWFDPQAGLAGFAFLDGWDSCSANLIFEVAPSWENRHLQEQVVDWAETSIRRTISEHPDTFLIETSVRSDDPARASLLEGVGFRQQHGGAIHMERSLNEPIETLPSPAGFSIRPIMGEAEVEAWVGLHRLALGTENMTCEYKLAMMRTPSYDPQLDLVAVAPDGRLAGYCVCFINSDENLISGRRVGYTDPIAIHPDFQRRGLSKALMLAGLSLLRARGMDFAALGTQSENMIMLHAAQSIGFRITKKVLRFAKPVHFDEV